MAETPAITSSELGILWLTYQEKTMILRTLEYFIEKADDQKAKEIITNLYGEVEYYTGKITETLQKEGAAIPVGFTSQDLSKDVPKLYDNSFDIMFIRLLKQISMGLYSLNITMTYREDIVLMFKEMTAMSQKYYNLCTQYLLEQGLLSRSPYVSMPKSAEFVKDTNYLGGLAFNPFNEMRILNTVEVAHLQHSN